MKELYLYIRKLSFTAFLTIHTVLWSLLGWLLLTVIKALGKTVWFSPYEELAQRFVLGFPVISQTVLCFIVFYGIENLSFIKFFSPYALALCSCAAHYASMNFTIPFPTLAINCLLQRFMHKGCFSLPLLFCC